MGGKKKKYNARFPPARIKKIMQTDEEVGKIAAAVPVVISRALELFLESIITESVNTANESHAKTLSSSHIKSVIQNKPAFDFLKSQVTLVPDLTADGAETLSAASAERRNSKSAIADSSSHSLPTSATSTSNNAQPSHPVLARKRSNAAPSTSISEAPRDPTKPKRKRGRPPKVKQPDNSAEMQPESKPVPQPLTSIAPSLLPLQQMRDVALTTNGEKVEVKREAVASVPDLIPASSSNPAVVAPIAMLPATAIHNITALALAPPGVVLPKPEVPKCTPGAFKLVTPNQTHNTAIDSKPLASVPLAMPNIRAPAPTCTVAPIVPVPMGRVGTEHVTDCESDGSVVESVFDTNTTIGIPASTRSALQPPAHTSNNFSRYYRPAHPLHLSYAKGPMAGTPMYADLSPSSQPIDLSNKMDSTRSYAPQSSPSNPLLTEYNNHSAPTTIGDKQDV